MKLATPYSVLLFCCMIFTSALSANDNYDINNISEEFIATYITGPISNLDIQGRNAVSTGSGCSITITKVGTHNDANSDGLVQEGETITYEFTVCNDGTEDLFNVTVNDPLSPVSGSLAMLSAMTGSGTTMTGSGTGITCDSNTFSTIYTVDAGDAANGFVSNTATVQSFDVNGNPVTGFSNTVVFPVSSGGGTIDNPSLTLFKSGTFNDENGDGFAQVGESINYSFEVCNDGNLDVFNLSVDDGLVNVNGVLSTLPATLGSANCNTTTFSANYTITTNDIANAQVVNVATVSGTDENGDNVGAVSNNSVVILIIEPIQGGGSDPSISLSKDGVFNDEDGDGFASIGESITYFFEVCNTGDDPITDISIFDPIAPVTTTILLLNPGSCNTALTSTYVLAQTDISNGQVLNIATVAGSATSGATIVDTSDDPDNPTDFDANGDGEPDDPTITTYNVDTAISNAQISLQKVGTFSDENNDGFAQAGETIAYTFTVCNDGNEDIFNIEITDPLVSVSGSAIDLFASTGSGTSCDASTFTALYTITDNDIANGQVTNVAFAQGFDRDGAIVIDYSDDPFNSADFDQDGDGNPDDPTVTEINAPSVALLSAIGNYVWEDLNGNGIQDFGEPGIADVYVGLNNHLDVLVAVALTDADGFYLFEDVIPGEYYLTFGNVDGYELTFANLGGSDLTDSDVDGSNGAFTTVTTTLSPGETDLTWDAGFYRCVPMGELVWYDVNQNNIFDQGENGLNGIKVNVYRLVSGGYELYDVQFTGHKPGTPSDDGYWKLCVPPGSYYISYVIPPFGLVTTLPNVGSNELIDSDVTDTFGPGTTNRYVVRSGDQQCDIGAGYYPQATLGDRVWYDVNRNGMQDISEPGAGGITVKIYDVQGNIVNEVVTDADGDYRAEYLKDSEYFIEVTPPLGYVATAPNVASDDMDSDIDHTFGANTTPAFRTLPGSHTPNVDAGLISSFILSADWLSVDAARENGLNTVTWSVANDIEVNTYTVERKLGNTGFFAPIGIESALNEDHSMTYSMRDIDSENDGEYFYRVKMDMYDGSVNYSDIVYVNVTDAMALDNVASIYPNPAINDVTLIIEVAENDSDISITIMNQIGQIVLNDENLGTNLDAGTHQFNLDVSNYSRGSYVIELFVGSQRTVKKMVLVE